MRFIYNDLLNSLALTRQYLLENGETYAFSDIDSSNDILGVKEMLEELQIIKRGINSSVGDTSALKEYISDYISIKYSPNFIKMMDLVSNKEASPILRKVSGR